MSIYTDYDDHLDELLIKEEYYMTLKESLEQEKHNLDLFNLEVAKYRLKHGMTTSLIHLYGDMGKLSVSLINTEQHLVDIVSSWENITGSFQQLIDKEVRE